MGDKQETIKEVGLLANSFKDINSWLVENFMAMGLSEYSANWVRIFILVICKPTKHHYCWLEVISLLKVVI